VIQKAHIQGVSSRLCGELEERVGAFLHRQIEGDWPCLWVAATCVKTREAGRIVSVAAIVAVGVNTDGQREFTRLLKTGDRSRALPRVYILSGLWTDTTSRDTRDSFGSMCALAPKSLLGKPTVICCDAQTKAATRLAFQY
jgi:hypothetical protein